MRISRSPAADEPNSGCPPARTSVPSHPRSASLRNRRTAHSRFLCLKLAPSTSRIGRRLARAEFGTKQGTQLAEGLPLARCLQRGSLARLKARQPGPAEFVNAVLRALTRASGPPPLPAHPAEALGVRWSFPDWIAARWLARYGASETTALMAAIGFALAKAALRPVPISALPARIPNGLSWERSRFASRASSSGTPPISASPIVSRPTTS